VMCERQLMINREREEDTSDGRCSETWKAG
jgi:hypothetical protein